MPPAPPAGTLTQWLAARARNALRRPLRIIGITTAAFVAALLILLPIPRQTRREISRLRVGTDNRPDTTNVAAELKRVHIEGAAAESLVVRRRARARGGELAPGFNVRTRRAQDRADSIARVEVALSNTLDSGRRLDVELSARAKQADQLAAASASPLAFLAAAIVVGIGIGFGVVLGLELRSPRIADANEATRVTGIPTLDTVGPESADPQWARRTADRELSPLISVFSERYRHIYAQVSTSGASAAVGVPIIAVVGDEASLLAAVATNIAVVGVLDSRNTLLIDADGEKAAVSAILQIPRAPGVTDVLKGETEWAAVIKNATVGRDRTLDVMPPGRRVRGTTPTQVMAVPGPLEQLQEPSIASGRATGRRDSDAVGLQASLIRLGRRYELIVVAAPAGVTQVGPDSVLPMPEALLCARVAYTTLERLRESVSTLQESGLQIRGIVLWDADRLPRIRAISHT
jgi:Mrp family chromosome partitioning ATPase